MAEQNPASAASAATKVTVPTPGARKRIPMSTPQQRMQVADLPGYHLHWFLESRVPRALQAGYEFVEDSEVNVNQRGAANKGDVSGNTDLGTQVRVIAGLGENGNPESHVLMKLKEELWQEDVAAMNQRTASVMSGIFRDEQILGTEKDDPQDKGTRYVGRSSERKALLNRPTRKYRT